MFLNTACKSWDEASSLTSCCNLSFFSHHNWLWEYDPAWGMRTGVPVTPSLLHQPLSPNVNTEGGCQMSSYANTYAGGCKMSSYVNTYAGGHQMSSLLAWEGAARYLSQTFYTWSCLMLYTTLLWGLERTLKRWIFFLIKYVADSEDKYDVVFHTTK